MANSDDQSLIESNHQDPNTKPDDKKKSVIIQSAELIHNNSTIIRFRGRAMILRESPSPLADHPPFQHFTPLFKDHFESFAYHLLGGVSRTRMADVFQFVVNTAPDYTDNQHLIAFDDMVWNTQTLDFDNTPLHEVVWRSPYPVSTSHEKSEFLLSLAKNDLDHYLDFTQSMAPIISHTKPDGVIWWVGSGANGKSSLMDALYRIFPGQLSSLTVKNLTDERDTPSLNGNLANIVKESSEGRVDDTQIYKAIGTHENFRVHKFHSQDSLLIEGNMHHIFSANNIPTFNDKGYSARRRTFIIPFLNRFTPDPTFNDRTFTPEALSLLISEMIRAAIQLRTQQYQYKFSAVTTEAKDEYDAEVNTVEDYAREMVSQGLVAFDAFNQVRMDYENWCAEQGYAPLGIANIRRGMKAVGFERLSYKPDGVSQPSKRYRLPHVDNSSLLPWGMSKPGFYTAPGFKSPDSTPPPVEPVQEALDNEW